MGFLQHEKPDKNSVDPDDDVKEWERVSEQTKLIIVVSLILSFFVGFRIGEGAGSTVLTRIAAGFGATLATVLIAGIPSAFAAQFTSKWRFVWLGITLLLLLSQLISDIAPNLS